MSISISLSLYLSPREGRVPAQPWRRGPRPWPIPRTGSPPCQVFVADSGCLGQTSVFPAESNK